MTKSIKLFFKGFIIGISNLIPGLSGGTVALVLGIYEDFLAALGHLFSNFKRNILFLCPILLGMVCSLISLSGVISYCLANYLFATILFFCGAILGGLPKIAAGVRGSKIGFANSVCFILAFLVVLSPLFLSEANAASNIKMSAVLFIKLIFLGIIASSTMVIPGVSGSAVLMALGYYNFIISSLHNLVSPDSFSSSVLVMLPYAIGLALGLMITSRIIEKCLKLYRENCYFAIMGFIISSVAVILLQNDIFNIVFKTSIFEIVIGFSLFIIGFISARKMGD